MGNLFISNKIQYKPLSEIIFTIVYPPEAFGEDIDFHLVRYNNELHVWEMADDEIVDATGHSGQMVWRIVAPQADGLYKYGLAQMVQVVAGDGITRPTYQLVLMDYVDLTVSSDTTYLFTMGVAMIGLIGSMFSILGGFRGIRHEIDKFISGSDDMEVIRRERTGIAGPRYRMPRR